MAKSYFLKFKQLMRFKESIAFSILYFDLIETIIFFTLMLRWVVHGLGVRREREERYQPIFEFQK